MYILQRFPVKLGYDASLERNLLSKDKAAPTYYTCFVFFVVYPTSCAVLLTLKIKFFSSTQLNFIHSSLKDSKFRDLSSVSNHKRK